MIPGKVTFSANSFSVCRAHVALVLPQQCYRESSEPSTVHCAVPGGVGTLGSCTPGRRAATADFPTWASTRRASASAIISPLRFESPDFGPPFSPYSCCRAAALLLASHVGTTARLGENGFVLTQPTAEGAIADAGLASSSRDGEGLQQCHKGPFLRWRDSVSRKGSFFVQMSRFEKIIAKIRVPQTEDPFSISSIHYRFKGLAVSGTYVVDSVGLECCD